MLGFVRFSRDIRDVVVSAVRGYESAAPQCFRLEAASIYMRPRNLATRSEEGCIKALIQAAKMEI